MMIILVLYTYRYCFPEVTGHKPRQCLDENENLDLSEAIVKFVVSVVFQERNCCDCVPGIERTFFHGVFFLSSLDRKPCPLSRIPGTRLVCAARIQSSWGWHNWHLEHCKIGEARGVSKKSTITWFDCRRNGDKWHTELHNLTTWKQVFALVYAMFAHTTANQTNSGTWKSHIHWNETSKEAEN